MIINQIADTYSTNTNSNNHGQPGISIVLLILLIGVIASSTVEAQDDSYEPGYIDWQVKPVEQLFVEGMTEVDAVLQREARPN